MISSELALRGSYDIEKNVENGLFERLFRFTKSNNPDLCKWETYMPHHYTYRSPDIQNEIIELLATMVREDVAKHI